MTERTAILPVEMECGERLDGRAHSNLLALVGEATIELGKVHRRFHIGQVLNFGSHDLAGAAPTGRAGMTGGVGVGVRGSVGLGFRRQDKGRGGHGGVGHWFRRQVQGGGGMISYK